MGVVLDMQYDNGGGVLKPNLDVLCIAVANNRKHPMESCIPFVEGD